MIKNNQSSDKELYVLAVMKYKKEHPNINPKDMFSIKWNQSKNYWLKNNILAEAIEKKILVEETKLYKEEFK